MKLVLAAYWVDEETADTALEALRSGAKGHSLNVGSGILLHEDVMESPELQQALTALHLGEVVDYWVGLNG